MRPVPLSAFLLASLLLAGCTGDVVIPAAADAPAPSPEAAETLVEIVTNEDGSWTEVHEVSGTVTALLWITHTPEDAPLSMRVDVGPNATRLRAEVSWEGNADFDAVLQAPRVCQESTVLQPPFEGLDCVAMHGVTKETGDGWFQDAAVGGSPSVVELEGDTLREWNTCELSICPWSAVAYYNAAAQTPFTLRLEVTYSAVAKA